MPYCCFYYFSLVYIRSGEWVKCDSLSVLQSLHNVGRQCYSEESILTGWFEHFSGLAYKNYHPSFDLTYLKQVEEESAVIYAICLNSDSEPQLVTDEEILSAVKSLNRGKAADGYGVTAEHVYHGGQDLLKVVKSLINNILLAKDVPSSLKLGILNPIFKNKGSQRESQNYRGITITPVLTRLIESVIKSRIEFKLLQQQNLLQRGFTKNSSPMNCALLVEEFYRNNKDLHKPTYVAFMDAKSAFDVVVHSNLMRKLYNTGIEPNEWMLINSLHQDSVTAVKWRNKLSSTYINQQGVRQGGVLSADLYKLYNNAQLHRIQETGKGARIGSIEIQAPACADDVTVLSNDSNDLQFLINVCKDYSDMDGYVLQDQKSVVLKMNSIRNYPESEAWKLGSKEMPVVDSTTHMGILRTSANQELSAVENNIQKAQRTAYSLMGAGLHGENGVDPETAMSLLNTYVLPVLLYGLEVIIPSGKAFTMLETQYKRLLKQILSLPITTADPAIYLLSGMLPVEATLHKRILSLFGNITRLPDDSIELRLAKRQLELKTFKSHSWFIEVKKILLKYDLPHPETLIENPPKKLSWKHQYNNAVNNFWMDQILPQVKMFSSLKYLSRIYTVGKCHPAVKPYNLSVRDVNRIAVKSKILTGTYILQTNRVKFNQNEVDPTCQLCKQDKETLHHFLITCTTLEECRKTIMIDIHNIISDLLSIWPLTAKYSLIQLIVDSSVILEDCAANGVNQLVENIDLLHYHSRRLVYMLHAARYSLLDIQCKRTKKKREKKIIIISK